MRAELPKRLALALVAVLAAAPAGAGSAPARGAVTNLPVPRFVSMRAERANVRRGPSLNQRVDWEFVRRGLPLEIVGEYGQWRRVRDVDGAGGWVHHSLLSGVRTAVVRTGAPVPLRDEPADGATVRALAQPGVIGKLQACDGPWCEITAGGVSGWLPRAALWGVGPDERLD